MNASGMVAGGVDASDGSAPSPVMFWLLVALAAAAFAPCVIVPVLEEYRALKVLESVEISAIDRMQADVRRQRRHLDALREDPLVVSRVALRDLAYRRPSVATVFVSADRLDRSAPPPGVAIDVDAPAAVARLIDWLPFADRSDVYGDPTRRSTLMGLAGALVVVAFVLYPPRRRRCG